MKKKNAGDQEYPFFFLASYTLIIATHLNALVPHPTRCYHQVYENFLECASLRNSYFGVKL